MERLMSRFRAKTQEGLSKKEGEGALIKLQYPKHWKILQTIVRNIPSGNPVFTEELSGKLEKGLSPNLRSIITINLSIQPPHHAEAFLLLFLIDILYIKHI